MSTTAREIKVDKRVLKQLSDSAIKKEPVRAVVELITNSDDSYRRLEAQGHAVDGKTIIEVIRKKKSNSIIRVIDCAEGFTYSKMEERVGGFGVDTSGLTEGFNVRGFFGRGLKEAILGLGYGTVESIKDGRLYKCEITEEPLFKIMEPKPIDEATRKKFTEKGISENGTIIEIIASRYGVKMPFFDTFSFQLERYYSLREINDSTDRTIIAREMDSNNNPKSDPRKLEYKPPQGKEILNKIGLKVNGFDGVKFDLQVFQSNDQLPDTGPTRENGLLIKGSTAIHDITLFKYEGHPFAQKLYGKISVPYIDELIKQHEPILSDRRDGLDLQHPFYKALKEEVEKQLSGIVKEIEKEEKSRQRAVENEKTKQRFNKAVEQINKIAKDELGLEGDGNLGKGTTPVSASPPNGFDFMPEYYTFVAGQRTTLSFKTIIPWVLEDKSIINFESDNEYITITPKIVTVNQEDADETGVVKVNIVAHGKSVGAEAIVTAKSGNSKAYALVKAVAKKKKPTPSSRGKKTTGLLQGIKYDANLGPKVRHVFDSDNNIVKISTQHPSVEVYLGPAGEGQDLPHCQVLVAELVVDSVCRELARRKSEKGMLLSLSDRTDAINREHNELINKYAHIIHSVLVSKSAMRA
jgi:hypothetical protein